MEKVEEERERGIAVDRDGEVYTCESNEGKIKRGSWMGRRGGSRHRLQGLAPASMVSGVQLAQRCRWVWVVK